MYRISLWYRGLSRGWRVGIAVTASCLAVVLAVGILYITLLKPRMVEVRTGTIVRDPVDGHVWEDNTETLTVNEKEATGYHVVYVDRLSEEHAAIKAAEEQAKADEARRLAESTGYQAVSGAMTEDDLANLAALQKNLTAMGKNLVNGMDMVNELYNTRNILAGYRDQVAATSVPPELAGRKQQALQILDLYIASIDSYINYMASMNPSDIDQAQQYMDQATAIIQSLVP
jgi:hypothetical protein